MQLDFGVYNQSNNKKLYIFTALLSASRYKFVKFQETPFKTMDVILTLLDCFDYFGGRPEEIVIDQDKLMVVCENYGDIVYTKDFKYFIQEMEIRMYVCRKADPESKGKVENLVKYVKYNFLNIRTFDSAENANKSVTDWLLRRANGKISQTTKKVPAVEIEKERMHLKQLRNSIFRRNSQKGREERVVSDNYISVGSSYYGLPGKYDNKKLISMSPGIKYSFLI
jgi:transposase